MKNNTIVEKELLAIGERTLLLIRVYNPTFKVGDICQDDIGHVFNVKSTVHYKFTDKVPKWYLETPEFQLEGDSLEIGSYLTRINQNID